MYSEQDIIELFNNLMEASHEEEVVIDYHQTEGLWVSDRVIIDSKGIDMITVDDVVDIFKNSFPNIERFSR